MLFFIKKIILPVKVPPAELEDLLLSHPEINDVAVIGVPELSSGEVPRAYIVLEAGSKLTEQQVIDFADCKCQNFCSLLSIFVIIQ